MVTKSDADKSPFILKKDNFGNVQKVRVVGPSGGEIQGTIQLTNQGVSYLVAGSNVTIVTQSNGQILISSTVGGGGSPSGPAGGNLGGTYPNPTVVDLSITGQTAGDVIYFNGTNWVRLGVGSSGQVLTVSTGVPIWSTPTTGDFTAAYVLMSNDPALTNNRVITSGRGIAIADGGALSNVTINTNGQVAMVSGTRFQGGVSSTSTGSFDLGLSGSLTRLIDGRSYLVAGSNITVSSQSNGQVTIAATATPPSAGDGIFVGPGSTIAVDGTVARVSGSHFTGGITVVGTGSFELGLSGSLTTLVSGLSYIQQPSNKAIFVASTSNGPILLSINDSVVAMVSGTRFSGNLEVVGTASFDLGLSGSLTRLTSGLSYLASSGPYITVASSSNGQVVISTRLTSSSFADISASYVVLSLTSSLPNDRILTPGTGVAISDGGPGSTVTINTNGQVAMVSGTHFTGGITTTSTGSFELGVSGSLTRLTSGLSYMVGGTGVSVSSQSNGQVTITSLAIAVPFNSVNAIPHPTNVSGTQETFVGSVFLPSVQYTTIRALLGSTGISDIATMRVRRFGDGSLISSLVVTGALSSVSSSTSVVIPALDWYDISIANSSVSTSAICYGVQFVGQDTPRQQAIDAIPSPPEISGTLESTVGSFYITTGTYSYAVAMIGTTGLNDTATLRLRRFTNQNIILTLTGSGNLSSVLSTGSVAFPANDWYEMSMFNSSQSGSAICQGLKVVG